MRRELSITPAVDTALLAARDAASALSTEVETLCEPELAEFVPAVSRVIARFDAVRLAALAAADAKRVGDLTGAKSTAEWVADATGEKPGRARRDVELAAKLDDLDQVGGALADGSISKTQADVLSRAAGATESEQRDLLDVAGSASVNELEEAVERFKLERGDRSPKVTPGVS